MSAITDAKFYLLHRKNFSFSPLYKPIFKYDKAASDGITAFVRYDSTGGKDEEGERIEILYSRHPRIANALLRIKGGVNFQIKEWAAGMARGYTIPIEIKDYLEEMGAPEWIFKACQRQKWKILDGLDENSKKDNIKAYTNAGLNSHKWAESLHNWFELTYTGT